MLKFTVQDTSWFDQQSSVLIDSIALYKGGSSNSSHR